MSIKDWRAFQQLNPDVKRLVAAWSLLAFGYFGIQGVLLNLYLLRLGFGMEFIGMLIAAGQVVWALVALPAGSVGQRIGLRQAILLGFSLTATGLGLLLAVEWLPKHLWTVWVTASWLVLWIGAAHATVNSTPYFMAASTGPERNHAFSAQAAMMALMAFFGGTAAGFLPPLLAPWIGSTLNDPAPYNLALWIAPLVYLLAIWIMSGATSLRVAPASKTERNAIAPVGFFLFLGLTVFLQTAGEGTARSFLNVYLDTDLRISTAQIGTIMGIAQLLPVWTALATPQLLARWGSGLTFAAAALGLGASLLLLGFVQHWLAAALAFAGIVAMASVAGTARNIFSQEQVSQRWRTTTSAILVIGLALGWATTAGAAGYLATAVGFSWVFTGSAVLALASGTIMLGFIRRRTGLARVELAE